MASSRRLPGQIFTAPEERAPAVRKTNLMGQQAVTLADRIKTVRYRMHVVNNPKDCANILKEWDQPTDSTEAGPSSSTSGTYDEKKASEKLKGEISSMQAEIDGELDALDKSVKEMELEWQKYGRLGADSDPRQLKSDIKTLIRDLGRIRKLSHMIP